MPIGRFGKSSPYRCCPCSRTGPHLSVCTPETAIDMLAQGGLLTEFLTGTNPDKHNFVSRNRIVAGMSDATIVVESAAKGGSLITAELAEGYHRDCFAVPGRVTDESSIGCNRLIRDNKAALIQSAEEFVQIMGWAVAEQPARTEGIQRNLFPGTDGRGGACCTHPYAAGRPPYQCDGGGSGYTRQPDECLAFWSWR